MGDARTTLDCVGQYGSPTAPIDKRKHWQPADKGAATVQAVGMDTQTRVFIRVALESDSVILRYSPADARSIAQALIHAADNAEQVAAINAKYAHV